MHGRPLMNTDEHTWTFKPTNALKLILKSFTFDLYQNIIQHLIMLLGYYIRGLISNKACSTKELFRKTMVALNFSFEDLPTSLLEKTDMLIGFSVLDLV